MLMRRLIQVGLIGAGVFMMTTLLKNGVGDVRGYVAAGFLILAGANPKASAWGLALMAAVCGIFAVISGAWYPPLGVEWLHVAAALAVAGGLHLLARPTEEHVYKCSNCFWHGPRSRFRFGACPRCGSSNLIDQQRSVLTGL